MGRGHWSTGPPPASKAVTGPAKADTPPTCLLQSSMRNWGQSARSPGQASVGWRSHTACTRTCCTAGSGRTDAEPPAAFVPIALTGIIPAGGSELPVSEAVQLRLQRGELVVNLQCPSRQLFGLWAGADRSGPTRLSCGRLTESRAPPVCPDAAACLRRSGDRPAMAKTLALQDRATTSQSSQIAAGCVAGLTRADAWAAGALDA